MEYVEKCDGISHCKLYVHTLCTYIFYINIVILTIRGHMLKERTTIEVDAETKQRLKHLGIQVGPACNNFLKNLVGAYFNDKYADELCTIDEDLSSIENNMADLAIRKTTLIERKEAILLKQEADRKKKDERIDAEMDAIKAAHILEEIGK